MAEPHFRTYFELMVSLLERWRPSRPDAKRFIRDFRGSSLEMIIGRDHTYRISFADEALTAEIRQVALRDGWFIEMDRDDAERALYDGVIKPGGFDDGTYRTNMKLWKLAP